MERQNNAQLDAPANIIEDDQQLYDWGIENRLDQYYHDTANGNHPYHHQEHQYVPNSSNLNTVHPSEAGFQGHRMQDSTEGPPPYVNNVPASEHQHLPNSQLLYQRLTPPLTPTTQLPTVCDGDTKLPDGSPIKREPIPPLETPTTFYRSPGRRPSLPQVDMDANEILKVERKRARNRVAASKCRLRKLERIAVLDQQAQQLRSENDELSNLADKLKAQVYSLKQELRWHVNNGCKVFGRSKSQVDSPDSTTPTNNSCQHQTKPSKLEPLTTDRKEPFTL